MLGRILVTAALKLRAPKRRQDRSEAKIEWATSCLLNGGQIADRTGPGMGSQD
jgi:hypothetical protein